MTVRRLDDIDKVLSQLEDLEHKRINAWQTPTPPARTAPVANADADFAQRLRDLETKRKNAWKPTLGR